MQIFIQVCILFLLIFHSSLVINQLIHLTRHFRLFTVPCLFFKSTSYLQSFGRFIADGDNNKSKHGNFEHSFPVFKPPIVIISFTHDTTTDWQTFL